MLRILSLVTYLNTSKKSFFVSCIFLAFSEAVLRPLLPYDTRSVIADKCVAIAAANIAGKVKEWVAKNLTKAFFRRQLKKSSDELLTDKKMSVAETAIQSIDLKVRT